MTYAEFVKSIQDALGTEEEGEALVEVARNAHKAEMELASILIKKQEEEANFPDPDYDDN
jgi:hypothetical protein